MFTRKPINGSYVIVVTARLSRARKRGIDAAVSSWVQFVTSGGEDQHNPTGRIESREKNINDA
ncbi:hypothetical protein C9J12_25610 [Photobacterium frigidiphilum]|uniref:Uncharacterized protein n=1 Tax=Photobacterium frigidiphilum TaxID=264736 RepID=A0A2T3J7P6_9GAMM|nr:hypothetical protein C9J12_25610 [Photobacterium frigidiphilum]